MKTYAHTWRYLGEFFLEWEMFQTEVAEKIRKHILCSTNSPPPPPPREYRVVYEIMRENVVEPDKPQMTVQYGACALHAG
jgi:hypothetical protein